MSNSFVEAHISHTGSHAGALLALLVRAIGRQAERVRHQRQVRRDINGLMELDDRVLADMGLSRCEVIYAVANGGLSEKYENESVGRHPVKRRRRDADGNGGQSDGAWPDSSR